MEEWKNRLAQVDDDYLVGLSNKGIVKRAYKDKQESAGEIESFGEEAVVRVGGETVTVRFPLGESKCTCPSRSMCRHVVHAILMLRESCQKGTGEASGMEPDAGRLTEKAVGTEPDAGRLTEEVGGKVSDAGQEMEETGGTEPDVGQLAEEAGSMVPGAGRLPEESCNREPDAQQAFTEVEQTFRQTQAGTALEREVAEYPFGVLKKALGSRHLQKLSDLAAAQQKPKIQYSSVITVKLSEQEFPGRMVVKLLSPLEYSSCTCHKKELCAHKAAAILWCQLEAGILSKDVLSGEAADIRSYDMEQVGEAAVQMKVFLEELLGAGLSRISPDVPDRLERLAIISHNAGLPRFEGYFRALSDSYDRYLKRKAAFRTEELMAQLCRLYRRADMLSKAEDAAKVYQQAGEFRADYLPAGNLDLIGIAMEHFQSQTGYEGETIYFLEEKTGKWYTYTSARPTFYEPGKKRSHVEKESAPWGLNLSLDKLVTSRLHLTGAKCDERRRLSSSQDTKGEIISRQVIRMEDIEGWYYDDFGKLFRERIGRREKWLSDRGTLEDSPYLVYVQPAFHTKAEFSQAGQQLSMSLYDKAGREIVIEVTYSKNESGTIRYLEKIPEKEEPCFLGKIYLRDGRIRMYPVDVWDEGQ